MATNRNESIVEAAALGWFGELGTEQGSMIATPITTSCRDSKVHCLRKANPDIIPTKVPGLEEWLIGAN